MRLFTITAAVLCALAWAGAAQAGTFSFDGTDVSYSAPSGETNRVFLISEERPVRGFRVIDSGAAVTAGAGCTSVGPHEAFCAIPNFPDHVLVSVDDMNDYVNTSAAVPGETRLEGGDGNDALYTGQDFAAVMDGGAGADVFEGELATVDYSSRTNPSRSRRATASQTTAKPGRTISSATSTRSSEARGRTPSRSQASTEPCSQGAGNDHISAVGLSFCGLGGGPGNDVIEADDGFCSMGGGGGNDTLIGGDDDQLMSGGEGDDVLRGGPGRDSLAGDRGADELIGGKGHDHARGGSGDDTFRMKDGVDDFIDGNQGADRAHVDKGLDELHDIEQLF